MVSSLARKASKLVIIGASKGLGRALAFKAAQEGTQVIAVARTQSLLNTLQGQYPHNITTISADITTEQGREAVFHVFANNEYVDIIYCAAVTGASPLLTVNEETLLRVINTNLLAPILLTQKLKTKLNRSRILWISSGLAHKPLEGLGSYCISKAGLNMAWKALNAEVPQEIAIFGTLLPGIINTHMQAQLREASPKTLPSAALFKSFAEGGRLRSPKVVADFVYWVIKNTDDETFCSTEWNIDNPPKAFYLHYKHLRF